MLLCADDLSEGDEDPDRDEFSPQLTGPLKCLQIDLRKFGLGMGFHYPAISCSMLTPQYREARFG